MSDYFMQNCSTTSMPAEGSWVVLNTIESNIKSKIEGIGTPLRDWGVDINYGIKTGFNEAFIIDSSTRDELIKKSSKSAEVIRPILLGRDIKRYNHLWSNLWLINSHNGVKNLDIARIDLENQYPKVFEYLSTFKNKLISRLDQGDHWSNLRNCAYLKEFDKPKIAWGNLSLKSQFTFIEGECFINAPSPFFVTSNLYLLGVLNSSVGEYYIKTLGVARSGGYIEFKPMFVEQLPIPVIPDDEQKAYSAIVRRILDHKKDGRDTRQLESELDQMIFKLYQLTGIEINHLLSLGN